MSISDRTMATTLMTVVAADDMCAVFDPNELPDDCPGVLKRFLGLSTCDGSGIWTAPSTDELGRLTFLKGFGISRDDFVACLSFMRSGYVQSLSKLVRTFDILGGYARLDAYVEGVQASVARREADELKRRQNPHIRFDDVDELFEWRVASVLNPPPEEWDIISKASGETFWWWRRKRATEGT